MDNAANVIANALVTGGNTLFEQSMLSGLSELFGGYDGFMLAVANAVLDLPSQFVPTLSKQAAGADRSVCTTHSDRLYDG